MNLFLADTAEHNYSDFLADVNRIDTYSSCFRSQSLFEFYLNFVVALSSNNPVTLIDFDISEQEIKSLSLSDINTRKKVYKELFKDVPELLTQVKNSKSEISIFTSGTTGQPKKIIHTVASLTRNCKIGSVYENKIWAFAYNPTHMAGLQVFFQAFFNSNTIVNVFGKSKVEIFDLINAHSINNISATPTFYRLLLPAEHSFPQVERVTFGGEKSDDVLHSSISKLFPNARINNIYASTEAGSLFSAKGECFQIPSAIHSLVKIENKELLIHKSLLGKSESFEFEYEYYRTGDLVEWINKENYIFRFTSRKNELINVGGYKVNPLEVESEMLKIKGLQQVVVYGKQNAILGNVLCANVLREPNSVVEETEIRHVLSTTLQDYKIPRSIKFVDELVLTRTGKIKRA